MHGGFDAGGPGPPGGFVAGRLGGGQRWGDDDQHAAAGGGEGDRDRFARPHLELDRVVGLDGRAVGGDCDGEVAVLAYDGARSSGGAGGGSTVVPEARREVKL